MPRLLLLICLVFPAAAQTAQTAQTIGVVIEPPQHSGAAMMMIAAERATTAGQRRRGLSHRKHLGEYSGMLFEYETTNQAVCMWMKDTHIPLAAVFVDKNYNIAGIAFMQPHSLTPHCSPQQRQIKYVLEINQKTAEKIHPQSSIRVEK